VRLDAQTGVVQGHVIRADRPVILPDADVELRPLGAVTRSDARGFFIFREVPVGRVEVAARRVGFAPAVVVVQVNGTGVTGIDIPLDPVATTLDPIVTSATRDARSRSEVAAAVSVADTAGVRRGQTAGLHETLRMMPGLQASSRSGTDDVTIGIRGSGARTRQAVRGIAVLLDGIPLTESDGVARLDLIELAASRQVEAVRGPVSALYAGSPNGLVNVSSRTGRDSRGLSARASRGTFGFDKYSGHAGGVFSNGRGGAFAAASYTSADGYRAHSDGDILRAQAAFDYVAARGTRVAIQANGSRLDWRLPGAQTLEEFDADPEAAAPANETGDLGRRDNRYRVGARLEQVAGIGVASAYFFYGGRTLDFPTSLRIVDLNLKRVQGGARFHVNAPARAPLGAIVGLDYDNIYGTDRRWENDDGMRGARYDDGYFSVPNLGAYAQLEWQATHTTEVTLGLRYDRVTYRFESYVSNPDFLPRQAKAFGRLAPKLSAIWRADSATSLYASAGRGFEVPAIGEISPSPGARLTSLYPKSLWNYEVGGRRILGKRAMLEGSIFYANVRGEFIPRTEASQSRPENASRSRNIGIELGATARATRHVEVIATYSLLDLRLRDYTTHVRNATGTAEVDFHGKVLPGVPQHRITGDVRVRPLSTLDFGVQVEWQSVVYVETGNADVGVWYFGPTSAPAQQVPFRAVPARALLHLNAAWRLGAATLFGNVENLFGVRYAGSVLANEAVGRFYEAGSPTALSLGLSVTAWSAPQRENR
jgi:iron complex outermembrane receptor protein